MISRKTRYLIAITLFIGTAGSTPALAENGPQLVLQMGSGMQAGTLRNGAKLGSGTLVSYCNHVGFLLWSEQAVNIMEAGQYVLTGRQNPAHRVRVRLVPQQLPVSKTADIPGITVNTSEDRVVFDILADSDQLVKADIYVMTINGTTLLP